MIVMLLRGRYLLASVLVLLLALGAARPAQASHLLGGEMTYRYLGATGPATAPHRYQITLAVYNNCASTVLNDVAPVDIYDVATGAKLVLTTTNYASISGGSMSIAQTSLAACTMPAVPPGCTIVGNSQSYRLQKFVAIVNLPAAAKGFYAYWTAYARNTDITNLYDPGNQDMSLYCTLAPPALANSSPVFVDKAVANLCANDTTYILNNAVDADGDQLVYSFGQPYGDTYFTAFTPPPPLLPYNSGFGYTATTPLGTAPGNYASINATTGIAKFRTTAPLDSKFVVAIDVREYRTINGQRTLIGITRRDVQLVVVTCPGTVAPVHPTAATTNPTPRAYTVEVGSTLTVPMVSTQAGGHPLTMSVSSVLLDGAGGYNATFNGNPGTLAVGNPAGTASTPSTSSPVAGMFVYTASCTDARPNPYDVTVTVKDDGCAGKLVGDVLRITVVKPTGPTAIAGNLAVCGLNTVQSYTATGGTAPTVSWTVTGGTIVGSTTANPVQVRWPTAGTGTVVAQGITKYGCLVDQVTKTVTVSPALALTLAATTPAICQGGSTTLTVAGGTAPYTLTGGAAALSGAGPFVLSPTQTTTYTVVGTATGSACPPTGQVTITVNPLPAANAGPAVASCSGATTQLGAAPVAGNTYSWSPATGLSNANIANPTVTLPNSTGGPITQTYTLTETTTSGCQASSSVAVTVLPLPVAAPGPAVAICSGSTAQLGAAPVAGNTYSWSPATGLSNATIANPTVTLTNTTGATITQVYTLTVQGAGSCTSTGTVAVTVNPLPVAAAGAPISLCSGGTGQLGAAPVAGTTYRWSPTTGLSNANIANPTVTLSNTTGAAITQPYTLTVQSAGSCISTATVTVTVVPLPVATPGPAVTICSGSTGQLGAAPVAGNTYKWSPATGLNTATIANPTVTLTNTTGAAITQTYTLTVTSAAGCPSTGTVAVTVSSLPVANAGAAVALCSGSTAQLGVAPVAGNTYRWSPATGLSDSNIANPTVTLSNTTGATFTQLYTLTVTTAQGCLATSTVAVTVNPQVVANAGAPISLCSGSEAQLGAAPVAGYTYSWSPATGLSDANSANPTVTLTNTARTATTQTYTLTATSATCSATSTVAVTVAPLPVATPGPAVTICSGGTAQLGTAPVADYTYSWSPATGLSDANSANPTVTLTNTTGAATTQTYTLTVTSLLAACTNAGTVVITVSSTVLPGAIGADQTVCAGSVPASLPSTAAASGGPGTYAYQWESSPDNSAWQVIANATSPAYTPGPVAATTYFRRRVTAGPCGVAYSNVVAVQTQLLLVPAVALPTLPPQCPGTALAFTPTPANAGAAPTYRWFVNGKLVGTSLVYTSTTLADGDQVRVELTPTAGFCASGLATATVRVRLTPVPVPTVTIALQTTLPVCVGAPISFSLDQTTNVGPSAQYQWQVDGVKVTGATNPTFTSATLRDGQAVTLVLRTITACGQPATATSNAVRVVVTPPVHVSAGPDKTITEGESVELEGTVSSNYPGTWTPTATLALGAGNPLHPVATPAATTTYTLSAGTGYCAAQSTVTVTVLHRVRIPNAFTPNGDNNDDTWQIEHIEEYPSSRVVIFNRWGSKLYEATGYNRSNEWNGTINGQPAPIGTYYYLVTLGNGKSYSGPLTIVY